MMADPSAGNPTGWTATLLVVSAEPGTVAGVGLDLPRDYEVRHAADRRTWRDRVDRAVDVVLCDRRRSRVPCEAVLAEIAERGIECKCIALVGRESADGVPADVDAVLELPQARDELVGTVETMLRSAAYDRTFRKYYALAARKAAFEAQYEPGTLADHRRYRELADRCDRLEARLDDLLGGLSWRDAYAVAFDRLRAPPDTLDG